MHRSPSRSRALYVEVFIRAPIERVWQLTQDPRLHTRWDARFTDIVPSGIREDGAQQFRYVLDLRVYRIRGTGVSLGDKHGADGTRTSALQFDADDSGSPLAAGRGYWRYVPHGDGVRFITGYDYRPGWGVMGRLLDPVITRRLVWWLTAWSFDRLRVWAEEGIPPERTGLFRGWFTGPRARARNCLAKPPGRAPHDVMDDAPELLNQIERHG